MVIGPTFWRDHTLSKSSILPGPWEVIVEPDEVRELLVVITAYPAEEP